MVVAVVVVAAAAVVGGFFQSEGRLLLPVMARLLVDVPVDVVFVVLFSLPFFWAMIFLALVVAIATFLVDVAGTDGRSLFGASALLLPVTPIVVVAVEVVLVESCSDAFFLAPLLLVLPKPAAAAVAGRLLEPESRDDQPFAVGACEDARLEAVAPAAVEFLDRFLGRCFPSKILVKSRVVSEGGGGAAFCGAKVTGSFFFLLLLCPIILRFVTVL